MRILLTGNGFDLSHNLPTKYSNFMNVITFLNAFEKEIDSFATVSDIFGNEYFIYCDKFIFDCNDKYKLAYQEAKIDRLELSKYINLSKTNVWIKYLKKIFSNSKENWIDFEREISNVINCLKYVFKNCDENTDLSRDLRDANVIYTILQFDDLIDINSYGQHTIKKTYLHKANKYAKTEINSKKIVSVLYKDLLELMEILKFYLRCFIENPLEKNVFFRYFDDEGVATFAKPLIEKGILKTYLYNLETARIDGVPSTGNGYKGSAKGKIGIRFNNVIVKEGKQSEEEIFSTISEGIYITEVQGLHAGMNKTSGNFSLQAAGFMIRDGKLAEPVNLITIAGNLLKVMEDIKALANNSETQLSSITCPSVYIKSIAVSGK